MRHFHVRTRLRYAWSTRIEEQGPPTISSSGVISALDCLRTSIQTIGRGNCNHRLEIDHLQTGHSQTGHFETPCFQCSEL